MGQRCVGAVDRLIHSKHPQTYLQFCIVVVAMGWTRSARNPGRRGVPPQPRSVR